MNYKELFIDKDDILLIRKELVRVLGDLNEAVILNQLNYWIEINKKADKNLHDGKYWIFNTYQTWKDTDFDFWSTDTIRRTLTRLENKGIVLTANYNKLKIDKTKWYTIDYDKLQKLIDSHEEKQIANKEKADCVHDMANCTDGNGNISKAIPENTNRDYNTNSKANSFFAKKVRENKTRGKIDQSDLIDRIYQVGEVNRKEVFTDEQADNVESCMTYFVERYAEVFCKKHPLISEDTIDEVMARITDYFCIRHENVDFTTYFQPLVSEYEGDTSYEKIIDMYFETEFKQDIDYSIVHFSQENILTKLMGKDTEKTWYENE